MRDEKLGMRDKPDGRRASSLTPHHSSLFGLDVVAISDYIAAFL
jgi:hypothetical protein